MASRNAHRFRTTMLFLYHKTTLMKVAYNVQIYYHIQFQELPTVKDWDINDPKPFSGQVKYSHTLTIEPKGPSEMSVLTYHATQLHISGDNIQLLRTSRATHTIIFISRCHWYDYSFVAVHFPATRAPNHFTRDHDRWHHWQGIAAYSTLSNFGSSFMPPLPAKLTCLFFG